jgi:ACT domain-containing protein
MQHHSAHVTLTVEGVISGPETVGKLARILPRIAHLDEIQVVVLTVKQRIPHCPAYQVNLGFGRRKAADLFEYGRKNECIGRQRFYA